MKFQGIAASPGIGLGNIVRLERGQSGVLEGIRNFRIDPAIAQRNQLENGWYRNR